MRLQRTTSSGAAAAAAVLAAGLLAGCGSGGGSGSGLSATQQITANWTAFFSPKTSTAKRVSLLQDGSHFSSLISTMSSSPFAKEASAKVLSAKKTSADRATVHYDVLLGKTPALKNQQGTALLQNGTWKVGDSSFCALMALESGGKAPSACGSSQG